MAGTQRKCRRALRTARRPQAAGDVLDADDIAETKTMVWRLRTMTAPGLLLRTVQLCIKSLIAVGISTACMGRPLAAA